MTCTCTNQQPGDELVSDLWGQEVTEEDSYSFKLSNWLPSFPQKRTVLCGSPVILSCQLNFCGLSAWITGLDQFSQDHLATNLVASFPFSVAQRTRRGRKVAERT